MQSDIFSKVLFQREGDLVIKIILGIKNLYFQAITSNFRGACQETEFNIRLKKKFYWECLAWLSNIRYMITKHRITYDMSNKNSSNEPENISILVQLIYFYVHLIFQLQRSVLQPVLTTARVNNTISCSNEHKNSSTEPKNSSNVYIISRKCSNEQTFSHFFHL